MNVHFTSEALGQQLIEVRLHGYVIVYRYGCLCVHINACVNLSGWAKCDALLCFQRGRMHTLQLRFASVRSHSSHHYPTTQVVAVIVAHDLRAGQFVAQLPFFPPCVKV